MGIYDGILFAVLVFFMILGFLRGLIKELATFLLMVLPIVAAMVLSPFLSDFLEKNTKIHASIEKVLHEKIEGTTEAKKETETAKKDKETKDSQENKDRKESKENKEIKENKGDKGTEASKDIVREGEEKDRESEKQNKEKILGYLVILNKESQSKPDELFIGTVTDRMVKAFSFVTVYLFFYLVLSIAFFALNVLSKLPVLSGFNRFFGALLGLGKALLFISILLLLLPFLYVNVKGTDVVLDGIRKSAVLKYLYEHNLILSLWKLIVK